MACTFRSQFSIVEITDFTTVNKSPAEFEEQGTVDIGYSDIGYSDILDIVILLSLGMNPRLHETHT